MDVTIIAPKGPGHTVRSELIRQEKGFPVFLVAVDQDYTGKAQDIALAYAVAIGGARAGVSGNHILSRNRNNLFGEQAVFVAV